MRFDPDVEPRAFRAAVVSRGELEQLRRIKDVIRLGHVTTIETNRIVLDNGIVEADPDTLYIDCSAVGAPPAAARCRRVRTRCHQSSADAADPTRLQRSAERLHRKSGRR